MTAARSTASFSASRPQSAAILPVALLLVLLAVVAYGLLAIALGQDANWDLRNYHYYDAYAFLTGRYDFDVVPAHVSTFYNPLLYVPLYWLLQAAPPKLAGFTLGGLQGLNFAVLLALAWRLLALAVPWQRLVVAAGLAAAGLLGAMTLSEVGTSFGDNVLSLLVLGALLILVWRSDALAEGAVAAALLTAVAAGLLAGLAAGLKQPMTVFAAALCLACFALRARLSRRLALAFCFGLGVLAGVAVSDGFWLLDLWRRYEDPIFPYFNEFFASPWATVGDYRDVRFVPKSLGAALLLPYRFSFGDEWVAEISFFDLRPVLVESLFLLWPLAALWRRLRPAATASAPLAVEPPARLVLASLAIAWLIWLKLFGIYRYMVPMELVMPLAILLLVDRLPFKRNIRFALAGVLLLAALASIKPGIWHRVGWSDDYFGVQVPALAEARHTIVLMVGKDPTAYVVPAFPPAVRFLRIEGWFTGPSAHPNRFDQRMHNLVAHHDGPIEVLFRAKAEQQTARDALAAYGLVMREAECATLQSAIERDDLNPLLFCPVDRMAR